MKFTEKLGDAIQQAGTPLMIGLDPVYEKLPEAITQRTRSKHEAVLLFCQDIIAATTGLCCGYKLNLAFFEALGADGVRVFEQLCALVPDHQVLLADAKRGDIGNTARQYAQAYYDVFGCDAITLNPLMGCDTLRPFLEDEARAGFVLALTSNPGAKHLLLQELAAGQKPVSVYIAEMLARLQQAPEVRGHIGMVVGATQAGTFAEVSRAFPEATLLVPGFGAQGGAYEPLRPLIEAHKGFFIPVMSRSIIYDFAHNNPHWLDSVLAAARREARVFEV